MNQFLVDMRTVALADSTSNHLVVEMAGPADRHINQEMVPAPERGKLPAHIHQEVVRGRMGRMRARTECGITRRMRGAPAGSGLTGAVTPGSTGETREIK